jgi:radical SAM protein with 4Fe4S-binding SPASM domain
LRCCYCYFEAGKKDSKELSTLEVIELINDLPLLNPRRITFTGGESLLREDVFELAGKIRHINSDIVTGITTNGTLINNSNAKELVYLFDEIRISIDGPREINDMLRGQNSFDQAIRAFDLIINAGGNPSAFITATTLNICHLKSFMKFMLSNGICKIHISLLKNVGRAKYGNLMCDIMEVNKIVNGFFFEKFGLNMNSIREDSSNCGVGKYISINPDGSVYPCHILSFPEFCIGNIKNEKLSSIFFNSSLMNKLRTLHFNEISQCISCLSGLSPDFSCLGMQVHNNIERLQLIEYFQK